MYKKLFIAVAALTVTACASPYVATPYDRAAANVQEIALVDDSLAPRVMAYEVASTGGNFGLIGALVDAGIQTSRQDAVNNALAGIGYDPETRLERRISAALEDQGYEVALLDGDREKRDFRETYPAAPEGADAYLDVAVTQYGYMSAGAGQPFRPTVYAKVRLVSVADNTTLMENMILYNPIMPTQGVITLSPNPAYVFRNREELLRDPAHLAAGIDAALDEVADTAARLMR